MRCISSGARCKMLPFIFTVVFSNMILMPKVLACCDGPLYKPPWDAYVPPLWKSGRTMNHIPRRLTTTKDSQRATCSWRITHAQRATHDHLNGSRHHSISTKDGQYAPPMGATKPTSVHPAWGTWIHPRRCRIYHLRHGWGCRWRHHIAITHPETGKEQRWR